MTSFKWTVLFFVIITKFYINETKNILTVKEDKIHQHYHFGADEVICTEKCKNGFCMKDYKGEYVCMCSPGFGKSSRNEFLCRVCECGENSISCKFFGNKDMVMNCYCKEGYLWNPYKRSCEVSQASSLLQEELITTRTFTSAPKATEKGTSIDNYEIRCLNKCVNGFCQKKSSEKYVCVCYPGFGKSTDSKYLCRDCECEGHNISCKFHGFGDMFRTCICPEGYVWNVHERICKEITGLDIITGIIQISTSPSSSGNTTTKFTTLDLSSSSIDTSAEEKEIETSVSVTTDIYTPKIEVTSEKKTAIQSKNLDLVTGAEIKTGMIQTSTSASFFGSTITKYTTVDLPSSSIDISTEEKETEPSISVTTDVYSQKIEVTTVKEIATQSKNLDLVTGSEIKTGMIQTSTSASSSRSTTTEFTTIDLPSTLIDKTTKEKETRTSISVATEEKFNASTITEETISSRNASSNHWSTVTSNKFSNSTVTSEEFINSTVTEEKFNDSTLTEETNSNSTASSNTVDSSISTSDSCITLIDTKDILSINRKLKHYHIAIIGLAAACLLLIIITTLAIFFCIKTKMKRQKKITYEFTSFET